MNENNGVILKSLVVPISLQMAHLHEEAGQDALLDVVIVVGVTFWCTVQLQSVSSCHTLELISDVVGLIESSEVKVVGPAPVSVHPVAHKSVESVEHGQVVSILVDELPLCIIGFNLLFLWSKENIGNTQNSDD